MSSTPLPLAFSTRINVGKGVYIHNPLHAPIFDILLPLKIQQQEQTFWCWASVAQALILFHKGITYTQCNIANKVVSHTKSGYVDCCSNPANSLCNCVQTLTDVFKAVSLNTLYRTTLNRAFNRHEIKRELNNSNPIGSFIKWDETSYGHFVIVVGFKQGKPHQYSRRRRMLIYNPNDLVAIADPSDGTISYVAYNLFTTHYERYINPKLVGTWRQTYF